MRELVIDSFAGGGGASTGIEWALGRSPDIAINHSPEAIAMHALNHPRTKHYCEDVLHRHLPTHGTASATAGTANSPSARSLRAITTLSFQPSF
jgi:site-specific DNA-cytosine methylase